MCGGLWLSRLTCSAISRPDLTTYGVEIRLTGALAALTSVLPSSLAQKWEQHRIGALQAVVHAPNGEGTLLCTQR